MKKTNLVPLYGTKTKTLRRVVRNKVSAEACAMTEALDTAHFISEVLSEILFNEPINAKSVQHRIPTKAYTDNHSIEIPILQQ